MLMQMRLTFSMLSKNGAPVSNGNRSSINLDFLQVGANVKSTSNSNNSWIKTGTRK